MGALDDRYPSLKQYLCTEDEEDILRVQSPHDENTQLIADLTRKEEQVQALKDSVWKKDMSMPAPSLNQITTPGHLIHELRGLVSDLTERMPSSRRPSNSGSSRPPSKRASTSAG